MSPALSLIIPTYNRGRGLSLLLDGLTQQTLPRDKWEVLLIDDGSTPECARLIDEMVASLDLPIRVWHRENQGPAAVRNFGIDQATHDIVHFLNDDLLMTPRHLERHYQFHLDHPEIAHGAHGQTPWHESSGSPSILRYLQKYSLNYDRELTEWEQPLVRFCTSSLSLKKDLLKDHRFDETFREPCFEDTELGYRLVREKGLKITTLEGDPAWHHHPHDAAALMRRAAMTGRNAPLLIERAPEFFDRLVSPFVTPPPWVRRFKAIGHLLTGDKVEYWRQLEIAVFIRAYWKAMGSR